MSEQGDITVIGNVGGIHLLEDIKVNVPLNVAVNIPAEMVIRSRDLQIALQKKLVLRAPRESGTPVVKKPQRFAVVPTSHVEKSAVLKEKSNVLEEENRRLRLQLQETQRRLSEQERAAQTSAQKEEVFQSQLDKITAALERLENRPDPVVNIPQFYPAPPAQVSQVPSVRSVDDDTPAFIQDMEVKADDVSIELETVKDTSGDVMNASKKLKSFRKRPK